MQQLVGGRRELVIGKPGIFNLQKEYSRPGALFLPRGIASGAGQGELYTFFLQAISDENISRDKFRLSPVKYLFGGVRHGGLFGDFRNLGGGLISLQKGLVHSADSIPPKDFETGEDDY